MHCTIDRTEVEGTANEMECCLCSSVMETSFFGSARPAGGGIRYLRTFQIQLDSPRRFSTSARLPLPLLAHALHLHCCSHQLREKTQTTFPMKSLRAPSSDIEPAEFSEPTDIDFSSAEENGTGMKGLTGSR